MVSRHAAGSVRAFLARAHTRVLDACGLLAGAAFGVLAVLISIDIVIRNLGIGHLAWLLETAEYTLYVATFVAAPWVLQLGAHVRVDLLVNAVPSRVALGLELLADSIGALASATLLYYGLDATRRAYGLGSAIIKELVVPEWWLLAVIPVSAGLLTLGFALRIRRAIRREPRDVDLASPSDGL